MRSSPRQVTGSLTAAFLRGGCVAFVPSGRARSYAVLAAAALAIVGTPFRSQAAQLPDKVAASWSSQPYEIVAETLMWRPSVVVRGCHAITIAPTTTVQSRIQTMDLFKGAWADGSISGASTHASAKVAFQFEPGEAQPDVVAAVLRAARAKNADPAFVLSVFWIESKMGSDQTSSTSSAGGPFQFLRASWFEAVFRHGAANGLADLAAAVSLDGSGRVVVRPDARARLLLAREDATASAGIAIDAMEAQRAALELRIGRRAGLADMYIIHLLGQGAGARFIEAYGRQPSVSSRDVVPRAVVSNPGVFKDKLGKRDRSVGEAYEVIAESVAVAHRRYVGLLKRGPEALVLAMRSANEEEKGRRQEEARNHGVVQIAMAGVGRRR